MSKQEKLLRLKRINIHGNGTIVHPDGRYCLYSEIEDLLRDETSGANVVHHKNIDPDGNEADAYTCITSDKLNLCFTAHDIEQAKKRYEKRPWLPAEHQPVTPKSGRRKKKAE